VNSVTFSTGGKFFITSCHGNHLYTWDIIKEADLLGDMCFEYISFPMTMTMVLLPQADDISQPASKMKSAPRIPVGFVDDALQEADVCDSHLLFYYAMF
jgi:hypothetical protein